MNELENKYVYEVYNSISNEFDNTRQYPWPVVKSFMNNLEPNSFVCDVGSGNGKNMFRNDLIYTSTDLSEKMCELSANKSDCINQIYYLYLLKIIHLMLYYVLRAYITYLHIVGAKML